MNCTGTYSSNEGHFLTADHCIQGCFQLEAKDWQDYVEYKSYEDPAVLSRSGGPEYFVFKRFRAEKIREKYLCDVNVNGQMKKAKLIASGRGRLVPYWPSALKSEKLKKQYRALQDAGVWAASDFAVLQLVEKPKTACIPLGDREPTPTEKLRAISYTCISTPLHPNNRNGDVPLYTEGVLATKEFFTGQSASMLTDGSTPPNSFWSKLAGETCSSGSSVLGSDGKILGVFNMLQYGNDKFGPATNLVRISGVTEVLLALRAQGYSIVCEQ